MHKNLVRNLLIGGGAYYFSFWIAPLLAWPYGKLTHRIIYSGAFETGIAMPLVLGLPYAVVSLGVGAIVVWLVESEHPLAWAALPAALYGFFGYFGEHWNQPPSLIDRISQVTGALLQAAACLGGAVLALRRRADPRRVDLKMCDRS